jgi:hypothetical protein
MSNPIFNTLINIDGKHKDCKDLEPRYTTNRDKFGILKTKHKYLINLILIKQQTGDF